MAYTIRIDLGTSGVATSSKGLGKIEAQSLTWGAARAVVGSSVSGAGGKVQFQELHFTKFVDSTTPELLNALSGGDIYHNVKITIGIGQSATAADVTTLTLKDVSISSIEGSADGVDAPVEDIGLLFNTIAFGYANTTGAVAGASDDWEAAVG